MMPTNAKPNPNPKPNRARPVPARAPAPADRYVADTSGVIEGALTPDLLDSLSEVKALAVREPAQPAHLAKPYAKNDLFAIAEIAYHYLFAGAPHLAYLLYDGVAALAPDEPTFALGLGLSADRLGDKQKARASYARAAALDAGDPRAEINLAELALEEEQIAAAKQHLARAVKKADARNDRALGDKARAIYRYLAHLAQGDQHEESYRAGR